MADKVAKGRQVRGETCPVSKLSDADVITYWAGSPVAAESEAAVAPVEEKAVPVGPPTIKMAYKEYMGCLPGDWRVSEVTPGTKTVYDNFGQCQRIFKAGRDY